MSSSGGSFLVVAMPDYSEMIIGSVINQEFGTRLTASLRNLRLNYMKGDCIE